MLPKEVVREPPLLSLLSPLLVLPYTRHALVRDMGTGTFYASLSDIWYVVGRLNLPCT